ncbi:MAG: response regulator [Chloroflexi bacterium]|nr:response regulator [Chloroflexota bacterium]
MNTPALIEILLVEDNPRDAELMIRAFKKRNLANNLIHLEDGAEALDYLFNRGKYGDNNNHSLPKIVLLDLKLPKIDGLDVLREIKKNEATRAIPVVIVTSSAEDPDIKLAYALGANSYVIKPVNFESFTEVMSNLGLYWLLINKHTKPFVNRHFQRSFAASL